MPANEFKLKKIAKNDAFRLNFNQLAIINESFFNQSNTVNAFEFNAKQSNKMKYYLNKNECKL